MKQQFTTFCAFLALGAATGAFAATPQTGYVTPVNGVCVGLNPAGTSVFGYYGAYGEDSQHTWIYDVDSRSSMLYPNDDPEIEGQVMWLNDTNVGVGTYRDSQWTTTVQNSAGEFEDDYPLNTACIWRDGERVVLDHNKWSDPDDFVGQDGTAPRSGNGFYAMRLSTDESKIVGYLKAFTYMLPVRWDRNADGSYTSTMLPNVQGKYFYKWVGASADGRRLVMNTSQSGGTSYIWDGDAEPWAFDYYEAGSNITDVVLTALSPNGNLAILSCMRNGLQAYGVYDFSAAHVDWIPLPEGSSSSNWFAANVVTDQADGFICDYKYELHYFNIKLGINVPFASYVEAYGDAVVKDGSMPAKALVRMISDDGRTICANTLRAGIESNGWIVRLPETAPVLFSLHNCELLSVSPTTAMIKWTDPELPQGASIKSYMVELDGTPAVAVEAQREADGMCRAYLDCGLGSHKVRFYAVAQDASGKEWESIIQDLEIAISPETGLFFFEDLCDSKVDETVMAYIYSHDTFQAAAAKDSGVLNFRLDGGDFYNLTPFWYTCGFSQAEWHTYLESRWFDATDRSEGFYFTWQERNMTINSETMLDADNQLIVEYTTDGEQWTELHLSDGLSNGARWTVRVADLSELAGEMFRLRFHARGAGRRACEWRVDYYGILPQSVMYQAPQGLMVTEASDQGIKLAWKNNRGEYEVSHNYNSPMTFNNNLGNGGEPFYTACDYGPSKLKSFEGKYITGVATLIYEPETVIQENHTKVQAVVFDQDGRELSRGTLADDAPWYEPQVSTTMPIHHIILDTPVLIEPDKTYRVSILITDYDPEMCPVWYFSASNDYIPGVTDLYSDDNLQSWKKVSDFFGPTSSEDFYLYGRCIFNIRPCITDTPQVSSEPYCQEQWFYQVYRDGELLPGGIAYYTQQSVTDPNVSTAIYTVRSFRRDGSVSEMSAPLAYTGISSVQPDAAAQPKLVREGDTLVVVGDFDAVAVYNVMGEKVAASRVIDTASLPHGVYLVVVAKDGKTTTVKYAF